MIYANGSASADKTLSIPGGEYSRSARKLVEFYNSMPGCEDFSFKTTEKLGIIGNGNVAIDIARVLASPISRLSPTDISSNALFSLSESSLKEINIYGRRGAIQSAMSVKELRYLHKISGISLRAFQDEIQNSLNLASVQEGKINLTQTTQQERARKRLFELINSLPREHDPQARVKVNLRFLLAPERFSDNKKLLLNVTSLQGKEYEQQAANTGKYIEEDCDMLIRSIGYSSLPIDKDLPFNEKEGVIRNVGGRVQDNVYVAGWARTGPFGVIDTTMRNVFVRNI